MRHEHSQCGAGMGEAEDLSSFPTLDPEPDLTRPRLMLDDNLSSVPPSGTEVAAAEGTEKSRSSSGISFGKMREKAQFELEHGPRLDREWAEGRANGTIPTFRHETQDAILTGNTFVVKDQIKRMLGRWDGSQKAWVVPAIGHDYCDRKTFDYVQKLQRQLDDLQGSGVVITYVEARVS